MAASSHGEGGLSAGWELGSTMTSSALFLCASPLLRRRRKIVAFLWRKMGNPRGSDSKVSPPALTTASHWKRMDRCGLGASIVMVTLVMAIVILIFFLCLVEHFLELNSIATAVKEEKSYPQSLPRKVCFVEAGGMMSMAIDQLGCLWMWGNCPRQDEIEDGVGFSFDSYPSPVLVRAFLGRIVVKVACGSKHVLALFRSVEAEAMGDLQCYAWGGNNHGQLRLGDKNFRSKPEAIGTLFTDDCSWAVSEIACGAYHTALLARNEGRRSKCWTFGLGENGQLGQGSATTVCSPAPVDGLPEGVVLVSLDCGLFHTCVLSEDGRVWAWGMENGLGLCPDARFIGDNAGDALSPSEVSPVEADVRSFAGPVQVVCGAAHRPPRSRWS